MRKIFCKLGIHNKSDFWAFVLQFMKFVVVGVSNTAVFLGIYYTLLAFGVFYLIANVFAFIFSVLNSFFWSRNFVFGKKSSVPAKIQLAKAYAAYGFTAIISTITLFIMVELIGISEFIAPLLNLLITVPINFLVNKFWTYK